MPELPRIDLHEHPYQHRPPRRPARLSRRLTPPPPRAEPPDLSLFLYAGIVLAMILTVLAIPYVIGYLVDVISR
ncbi:MAG: hypothetical protein M3R49_07590 [Chloroflexota bacterium]|nr:hypothetical protein [Chloroflexota bacterium]